MPIGFIPRIKFALVALVNPLGKAQGGWRYTRDGVGYYRPYENGIVYKHPSVGTKTIYYGPVFDKWVELGAETGVLGYPVAESGKKNAWGLSQGQFQHGTISTSTTGSPEFQVYAQNTALISPDVAYKGRDRDAALNKVIDYLQKQQPAVAGLSEVFKDAERGTIIRALKDIYPYFHQGPDEADFDEDGGLLLLSKYPMEATDATIYRQFTGIDGMANKGVLYARVKVPGWAVPMDVYLTHTQDGDGGKLSYTFSQIAHLRAFVDSTRNPLAPALVMGDVNVDLNDAQQGGYFRSLLGYDVDVWEVSGDKAKYPKGITCDYFKTFESGTAPVNDPRRQSDGRRLDALVGWWGMGLRPRYTKTEIVMNQTAPGIDLSDHYGLLGTVKGADRIEVNITRPITKVTVGHDLIRCLKETTGGGSDSVYFDLACQAANSANALWGLSGVRDDVDTGETHAFESPVVLSLNGDPGGHVQITVNGAEEDDWWGDHEHESLFGSTIQVSRRELLEHYGQRFIRTLPLLRGDGSEYAISVWIEVV